MHAPVERPPGPENEEARQANEPRIREAIKNKTEHVKRASHAL